MKIHNISADAEPLVIARAVILGGSRKASGHPARCLNDQTCLQ